MFVICDWWISNRFVFLFQGSLFVIVIMIDGSEKRNFEGGIWTLEFTCLWKAQVRLSGAFTTLGWAGDLWVRQSVTETCTKIYFPGSVLACNFCTEIKLFVCASFRVFSPKLWRGKIVPSAVFVRDNFKCSAGLAQWRGLAQTLPNPSPLENITIKIQSLLSLKGALWLKSNSKEGHN